jgi:hypothetical protein
MKPETGKKSLIIVNDPDRTGCKSFRGLDSTALIKLNIFVGQ